MIVVSDAVKAQVMRQVEGERKRIAVDVSKVL